MRVNMMMHHVHNNNVISRTHLVKSSELKKKIIKQVKYKVFGLE